MKEQNIQEVTKLPPPVQACKHQEIRWINTAKACCIYFVVLGHALKYDVSDESYIRNFLYSFHLPVFFFISGYLYRFKENNFKAYLISNIKSLVVPYIFLNCIAIVLFLPSYIKNECLKESLYYFLIGHGHAPAGPAWFLLCLFWIKIQMYFICRLKSEIQLLLVYIYATVAYHFPFQLYWDVDASWMAIPLFFTGKLAREKLGHIINGNTPTIVLLTIFALSLVITGLLSVVQGKEAIFSRMYGTNAILFYISSFCGISMIISFCKLFEGHQGRIISIISSGSIVIMGLHLFFYNYTYLLLGRFTSLSFWGSQLLAKSIVCILVLAELYYPIVFLQNKFSFFLGGRKSTVA